MGKISTKDEQLITASVAHFRHLSGDVADTNLGAAQVNNRAHQGFTPV